MTTPAVTPGDTARLDGYRVLVLGAAGEVGEGIVRALLGAGAAVVALSRSGERLEALRVRVERASGPRAAARLETVRGDVLDAPGAPVLRRAVERAGPLDGVVASLGGWRQGPPVVETTPDAWDEAMTQSLTAHVRAARTFLPLVRRRPRGSWTLVNGGAARHPVPGAGAMSVSAAAQLMLKDVLAREHGADPVRINTLLLATPVRTRSRPAPVEGWIGADDAGAWAVDLVAGDSVRRGETIVVDAAHARPPRGDGGRAPR